jgi:hypothetical protein
MTAVLVVVGIVLFILYMGRRNSRKQKERGGHK